MKLLKAVCAAAAALLLSAVPVSAAEDTAQTGTINVSFPEKSKLTGAEFGVYQVAVLNEGKFENTESFKNLGIDWMSIKKDPESTESGEVTNEDLAAAKTQVEKYISDNKVATFKTAAAANSMASFTDLKPGVYYVAQTKDSSDSFRMTSFIATIPFNGSYTVNATAKTSGQTPTTPDNPNTPATPTTPTNSTIPKTGMNAWMIPFFAVAGLFFIALGALLMKNNKTTA